MRLVLAFLAGIIVIQSLAALPDGTLRWGILFAVALMAGTKHWQPAALLLGMLWAIFCADNRLQDRLPANRAGQDFEISGTVADLPEVEAKHVRFDFIVAPRLPDIPGRIRLTWYHPEQSLKAGQTWHFSVRLKPPHGNFNPGGFDYERWLFSKGIGATGYVRTSRLIRPAPVLSVASWRQRIADRLDQLPVQAASLAMIKALSIGEGNSLSPLQWDVFRKTGTTHLMVISGSHVALVAGLVYFLVLKFWARSPFPVGSPPSAAAFAAIIAALAYAALTGFAVPSQRAALMMAVVMVALIGQKNLRPCHALGQALWIILLLDPLVVLAAGFWLSFAAVGLIVYALGGRLAQPDFLRDMIKINAYTSLGLAPLLLFFFQQVSLIAPLANLVAVPIISFLVVPLALLATTLLWVTPTLGNALFAAVAFVLDGLWRILAWLAGLPHAIFNQAEPSWFALVLAVPGMVLLLAPKGMPSRWLGLVLICPLIFTPLPNAPLPGTAKLTLLDVGQGLSAVVKTASHTLVYDTGAKFSDTSDAGRSTVMPYLRSQGITHLDSLVISHGDNDHIGGAVSLLSEFAPDKILTSVPDLLAKYRPQRCQAGQSWQWDKVVFTILSPHADNMASDNDNSCVLQISSASGVMLLTGDIEAGAEAKLVADYGDSLKAHVLVAPHHGSNTSSTPAFLHKVKPEIILIPTGYLNAFGHPHDDVLARYRSLRHPWLTSANQGAVAISLNADRQIESWRKIKGRYWHFQPKGDQ